MSAMFKFARPLAFAGLFAVITAPAFAADAIESIPEPVAPAYQEPAAGWTGGYAGVQAGYGFGRAKDGNNRIGTDGITGGAFAGYNHELGNGVVVGAEGDVGYSNIEGTNAAVGVRGGFEGSVRGRVGYAATPDVMPYVTAGGAAKRATLLDPNGKDRTTALGWTAGAGVDVKATEKVFVRGEYRYTDYGNEKFNTGAGERKVGIRDSRVQMGVGLKF